MNLIEQYYKELTYLEKFKISSIMISTTAKHALEFRILPRRSFSGMGISCFMINDKSKLKKTLSFFDGKVDKIYIDVEQKQSLNIFENARRLVKNSELITVKPNDITIESADLLIRHHSGDDLYNKNITVIGTGNLASKIAVKLAERQANIYIAGRVAEKEKKIVDALNMFLPRYVHDIQSIDKFNQEDCMDVVISFLSGQYSREDELLPLIRKDTFVIDGGINNFSSNFIKNLLVKGIQFARLDTRIALPYQVLSDNEYIHNFFNNIFGKSFVQDIPIAAGGYIGKKGTVIVDNIKQPLQVIGIADGSGGVIPSEELSTADRFRIQQIRQAISDDD